MITFLIIFAISGWSTAFFMMHQRNQASSEHSEDIKIFRNKVVEDLGFKNYVDFSTSSNYKNFTSEVLNKVKLIKN